MYMLKPTAGFLNCQVVDTCQEIFDFWQGMQARAQYLQFFFNDDHINLSLIDFVAGRIPE